MLPYRLALLSNLARNWMNDHADNYDHADRGAEPPAVLPGEALQRYTEHAARGAFLYDLLADQPSRKLLLDLLAFRILGHRKVKLPRNTPKYWQDIASMSGLRTDAAPMPIKFMNAKLGVFDLRPLGYEFCCHATPTGSRLHRRPEAVRVPSRGSALQSRSRRCCNRCRRLLG